jgi:hypothetical protein
MSTFLQDYSHYPKTVRAAFLWFFAAWIWHYFSLYMFFLKGEVPIEQIAIGIMLFISLVLFKKWGRVLSMIFNFLAIIWFLWLSVHFYYAARYQLIWIATVNVTLFAISSYFLFNRTTKAYFIKMTEEKEKEKMLEIETRTKALDQFKKNRKKK